MYNHDFLTLWRFEWISLRNGDFKFEKTIFKWRVRWTFQRSFKFINVGLILAPKWLSRIGTLQKDFFFIFNFLKNSRSHLSSYLFHPFEFCLQTCHSLHFREVFVFSLNCSLFDTDSARFVLKFLFFVSLELGYFFHRKAIFLFLFFENFRTILICWCGT